MRSTEDGRQIVALSSEGELPDGSRVTQIGSTSKKWTDGFGGVALDTTKWEIEENVGGMTMGVTNSALTVGMGTTINASLKLLSKEAFTLPVDVYAVLSMSQRIANNNFYVELVEVDDDGAPVINANLANDWANRVSARFQSTVATTILLESVGHSSNFLTSISMLTQQTTAAAMEILMEARPQDVILTSGAPDSLALRNATAGRVSSQLPDPNKAYKLRLRFLNGGVAPASNTNVIISHVSVMDIQELAVEITSGRGDAVAGKGIPVNVIGTVPVSTALSAGTALIGAVSPGASATVGTGTINARVAALATDNPVLVLAGARKLYGLNLYNNTAATKFFKLYNKATAPTSGDTPVATIIIPANGQVNYENAIGKAFSLGLGYRITGALADADATAVAAGDVHGMLDYI